MIKKTTNYDYWWLDNIVGLYLLNLYVEEIAEEYAGKATICKMNTDDHRDAAVQHAISAIPTLILFSGGQVAKKWVGLTTKDDLTAAIDEELG